MLRRCAVALGALVAVAAALAGAVWLGTGWGGSGGDALPAVEAAGVERQVPGAAATNSTPSVPLPSSAPPPAPPAPAAATPLGPSPALAEPATSDLEGWAALLGQLYARRSGAYAAGDAAALAEVYSPDSAMLRRDAEQVAALAAAGETLTAFAPAVRQVVAVTPVPGDAGSVVVDLVDEVPGYRVLPAGEPGGPPRELAGRGPAEVRMTLCRTEQGWRIVDATRRS